MASRLKAASVAQPRGPQRAPRLANAGDAGHGTYASHACVRRGSWRGNARAAGLKLGPKSPRASHTTCGSWRGQRPHVTRARGPARPPKGSARRRKRGSESTTSTTSAGEVQGHLGALQRGPCIDQHACTSRKPIGRPARPSRRLGPAWRHASCAACHAVASSSVATEHSTSICAQRAGFR